MISKYLENKIHFFLQIIFLPDIKGYIVEVNNPLVDVTFKWGTFKVTLFSQSQGFEIMDKFSTSISVGHKHGSQKLCFVDMH